MAVTRTGFVLDGTEYGSLSEIARKVTGTRWNGLRFFGVRQAFNTTSSMGRLTLNVLLSFAQFEREVTGERIRDKIAASKARGMWMGGNPPLGYDASDRRLVINEDEAAMVRHIFERYLELGSVPQLCSELNELGIRSKFWIAAGGRKIGGVRLRPGAICYMLNNRIYVGEIVHKGKVHTGNHEPIISVNLYDQVQRRLAENRVGRKRTKVRSASCWLAGKITDISGQPMGPSFAYGRKGRLYRYYVAQEGLPGGGHGTNTAVSRVSAQRIERLVAHRMAALTGIDEHEHDRLLTFIGAVEIASRSIHVLCKAERLLEPGEGVGRALERLTPRLPEGDRLLIGNDGRLRLVIDVCPQGRGRTLPLKAGGPPGAESDDPAALETLRRAHRRLIQLNASPLRSETHGSAEAPVEGWSRNGLAFAFLAPDLQKAMLKGDLSIPDEAALAASLPLAWSDQSQFLQQLTSSGCSARLSTH